MRNQTGKTLSETRSATLQKVAVVVFGLIAMIVAAGCAKTKVQREPVESGQLSRPGRIWVYDFAATPADLPIHSTLAGQYSEHSTPQTDEQIAEGRKLGAEIQSELVAEIREMGLIAEHATKHTKPQLNDLVIQGYIVSFEEGEKSKRVLIGLGSGSSHLNVAVEGFQLTNQGLRKLGGGTTEAGGGKTPGAAVGAATLLATHNPLGLIVSTGVKIHEEKTGSGTVEGRAKQTAKEIAEVLGKRFQEQGWID